MHEQAEVRGSILGQGVEVGSGARLHNCIVDKHVKIPPGESIGYELAGDGDRFTVSENGIVVIPRNFVFEQEEPAGLKGGRKETRTALSETS